MIYLDNAATMKVSERVRQALQAGLSEFGNPSSNHKLGKNAQKILENSRARIAEILGCQTPGNIYFTSGATEAANTVLKGYAEYLQQRGSPKNEIIISSIEHPAINETADNLIRKGLIVHRLKHDVRGLVDIHDLDSVIGHNTALVAIMWVNNETGTIQNINTLATRVKEYNPNIFFITDAVQAIGKIKTTIDYSLIDSFFISGHKIGTPKGMGALYVNPQFKISPLIFGGGQEFGLRSGTSTPLNAVMLAEALDERMEAIEKNLSHINRLQDVLLKKFEEMNLQYVRVVQKEFASPYILAVAFPGVSNGFLVETLSEHEIYISRGSACSSNVHTASRILEALRFDRTLLLSVVRISFSPDNSEQEMQELSQTLRVTLSI